MTYDDAHVVNTFLNTCSFILTSQSWKYEKKRKKRKKKSDTKT